MHRVLPIHGFQNTFKTQKNALTYQSFHNKIKLDAIGWIKMSCEISSFPAEIESIR